MPEQHIQEGYLVKRTDVEGISRISISNECSEPIRLLIATILSHAGEKKGCIFALECLCNKAAVIKIDLLIIKDYYFPSDAIFVVLNITAVQPLAASVQSECVLF